MKRYYILLFVIVLLAIPSCGQKDKDAFLPPPTPAEESSVPAKEDGEEDEGPVQMYSYEESAKEDTSVDGKKEIVLEFAALPSEIKGAGFVRFAGQVDGVFIIEIAGEGRLMSRGDRIGDYRISGVERGRVILTAEEEALCAR